MSKDESAHPHQSDVEDFAFSHYQVMTEAVIKLLLEKNIITADELRNQLEKIDSTNPINGSRMIARAWKDSAFKLRMKTDVNAAATEMGIDPGHIPILAVENTPTLHNVIVCTLCSCYPRGLIGLPPDWYKSRAYRARLVKEPRVVLKEFGTNIPETIEVRVHDSTADLRYLVIPMRPEGSSNMEEDTLAELVTRDSMIGISIAKKPNK